MLHRAAVVTLISSLCLGAPQVASADEGAGAAAHKGLRLSVASDVTPWLLEGFSVLGMVEAPSLPHWRFSVEVWGMALQDWMIELDEANVGEDWAQRIDYALALYADYHPRDDGAGSHLGLAVNAMHSKVRRGTSEPSEMWALEVLLRAGYRWFPVPGWGLFLDPWLGLGHVTVLAAPHPIDGERLEVPSVQGLATVHLGWRF